MNEEIKTKKSRFPLLRAGLVSLLCLTLICGIIYPLTVTIFSQSIFPYEANGSLITVTLEDGTKKVVGSELIGQSYIELDDNGNPVLLDESGNVLKVNEKGEPIDDNGNVLEIETFVKYQGKYLIGRNNSGAPSNASPNSEAYHEDLKTRKKALEMIGFTLEYSKENGFEDGIPQEMITESGSGCDPEISYDVAMYQIKNIVNSRKNDENSRQVSEEEVISIINKYTKGRFLGIFGTKRVNVLMVNLALDGLI